jgi:hypothetical protein
MRVLVLVAAAMSAACSSSGEQRQPVPTKQFECLRAGNGPWRECALSFSSCESNGGCFKRDRAFCFPYMFTALSDSPKRGMICTPTSKECEEWHEDRLKVVNRALGPCVESRAEEYLVELVPMTD